LLKTQIPGARVLSNPAKLCLEGKELVLANYPLIKNIVSQSLVPYDPVHSSQRVTDLVYSQGSITMAGENYWPQADYFNISSETLLVVTDSIGATGFQKSKGKFGGLANTGNFERDGDFLCLMSWAKNMVQSCGEQTE
jgi:hypothetical protein